MRVIERETLDALLAALRERGYTTIGPTIRDQAIVYDEISSTEDLPAGWTDEQDGGTYRLHRRDDEALFGYVVGPRSWKSFLHPPRLKLFRASRNGGGLEITEEPDEPPRYAFIGGRSCDLHAFATQDRVLIGGEHPGPHYAKR